MEPFFRLVGVSMHWSRSQQLAGGDHHRVVSQIEPQVVGARIRAVGVQGFPVPKYTPAHALVLVPPVIVQTTPAPNYLLGLGGYVRFRLPKCLPSGPNQ